MGLFSYTFVVKYSRYHNDLCRFIEPIKYILLQELCDTLLQTEAHFHHTTDIKVQMTSMTKKNHRKAIKT
ncbi:hypothetical protein EAKF1_ch1543 [Escherichia albertii KF1]|nr:hypothetical protein EAKF1_ch1543 [Escherichia albertii KF1]